MGYYANTMDTNFIIKKDNLEDAYKALCALNATDEGKNGYFEGDTPPAKPEWSKSVSNTPHMSFKYMDWNYDENLNDVFEVFSALGFEARTTEDGDFELDGYDDIMGDHEIFFAAVAPFVEDGSYVEWEGSDGERWRNQFDGGEMKTLLPKIVWVEEDELWS